MEPKRINVVTIGPVPPEKKDKKERKTFRFNLALIETTDKTCPEFSFGDLAKSNLGDDEADVLDPFAKTEREEADKLAAMARAFENKYTDKSGKKRKRVQRLEDIVDLGDGYDLDDPFIDNTEAYDEVVPCNMTTKHGGFYINSGALDFKFCSDSDDDFQNMKKSKKRLVLSSDSEVSEMGEKKKKKKKKLRLEGDLMKTKKKLNGEPGLVKKKKKLVSSEKIKQAKIKKGISLGDPKSTPLTIVNGHTQAPPSGHGQKQFTGPCDNNQPIIISGEESKTSTAGSINKDACVDLISPEKREVQLNVISKATNSEAVLAKTVTVTCDVSSTTSSATPEVPKPKPEVPNLPETLSLKTVSNIDKIKDAAKKADETKGKVFTPDINHKLLQVEKESRLLKPAERNVMYTHLAAHLPVSKDTLMKRVKRLVTGQQDDSLREPINKLREAVVTAMPVLLEKHQTALAEQKRLGQHDNVKEKDSGNLSNDSDENSQEKTDATAEKQKRTPAPRRKFEWTPHIRSLLCDVVRAKMEHFEIMKARAQTAEEYLRTFLDAEVKIIWPTGWVQTRTLLKESRDVHAKWTNPTIKPKKPLVPGLMVSKPGSATTPPVSNHSTSKMVVKTPSSNPNTPVSGLKIVNSLHKLDDSRSSLCNISPSVFASPDLISKPASFTNVKSSQKTPTLLDYAGNSFTAVAKSKQTSPAATVPSNISAVSMAKTMQLAQCIASQQGTTFDPNDYIQQFKNFAKGEPHQQQTTNVVAQTVPQKQPMKSQDSKKSQQCLLKSQNMKSGSSFLHGQHKTTAQSVTQTNKGNTGSGSTSGLVAKQNTSLNQQRHSPSSATTSSQKQSVHSQRTPTGALNLSQNSQKQSHSATITTHGKSPSSIIGLSNQSPRSLANQSVLNVPAHLSPYKSEHSAHNSSTESDDIPLARLSASLANRSLSTSITPSYKPNMDTKTAFQYAQATKTLSSSTYKQSPASNVISGKTHQGTYHKTGAVNITPTGSKIANVKLQNATSTGPKVIRVMKTSSGALVRNVIVKTVSPSSTQHTRTVSSGHVTPDRIFPAQMASPSSQENDKRMEQFLIAQKVKHAASQLAKQSHSLAVNSSVSAHNVSQGQSARSSQNSISMSSQRQVSRSPQAQFARPEGPVASSSPRPLPRSPQSGSSPAWLPGEQRGYNPSCAYNTGTSPARTSTYPTGLALLDLAANATSSQGLQQQPIKSPGAYGQGSSFFTSAHGQRSPIMSPVTSPLHQPPQQPDQSQYRRF